MNPNQNMPNPEIPVTEPPIIPDQQNGSIVQNVQPVAVEPVVQQPIEAVAQPPTIPSNPTIVAPLGAQPQVVNDLNPIPVKKSKTKLGIVIIIAVVVLAGTAFAAWYLNSGNGIKIGDISVGTVLKEHSNDTYSIMIPDNFSCIVAFNDDDTYGEECYKDGIKTDNGSFVYMISTNIPVIITPGKNIDSRTAYINSLENAYTDEMIKTGTVIGMGGYTVMSDLKVLKSTTVNGVYTNIFSAKSTDGEKFMKEEIVSSARLYQCGVMERKDDVGISTSADKIIDSFRIK